MNLTQLPDDLPIPIDDGAAKHLTSLSIPNTSLLATNNQTINLKDLSGILVIYIYPMTAHPDKALPNGWDDIPGARGCTPQACSFRDHYAELQKYNAQVYGLSTQTNDYQREAKQRLHLPFELLSDSTLKLKALLNLPSFEVEGMELYKRLTLIIRDGIIIKVFYPVFPTNENVDEVLKWLKANTKNS